MTTLIILLAIAAVLSAAAIRAAILDGRGPQHPPASHYQDLRFQAPGRG